MITCHMQQIGQLIALWASPLWSAVIWDAVHQVTNGVVYSSALQVTQVLAQPLPISALPRHTTLSTSTPLTPSALPAIPAGKRDGVLPGETVPYVICRQRGADGELLALGGKGGVAERAHHPEELLADPSLVVDLEYYLMQQVGEGVCAGWGWGGLGLGLAWGYGGLGNAWLW